MLSPILRRSWPAVSPTARLQLSPDRRSNREAVIKRQVVRLRDFRYSLTSQPQDLVALRRRCFIDLGKWWGR